MWSWYLARWVQEWRTQAYKKERHGLMLRPRYEICSILVKNVINAQVFSLIVKSSSHDICDSVQHLIARRVKSVTQIDHLLYLLIDMWDNVDKKKWWRSQMRWISTMFKARNIWAQYCFHFHLCIEEVCSLLNSFIMNDLLTL